MPDPKRRYSEDEVRAILDRALRHDSSRGIGHEELLAAASEVGISGEALQIAIREAEVVRAESELRAGILERRRRGFRGHLTSFLAVNAMLVAINAVVTWMTGVFVPWAVFPLLGWGLGLFFHGRSALNDEISPRELAREREKLEKARRKLEREQRKTEEEAAKRARREKLERRASELGEVVEEGVSELLGAITKELGGAAPKPPKEQRRRGSKKRAPRHVRIDAESLSDDDTRREAEAELEAELDASREARRPTRRDR